MSKHEARAVKPLTQDEKRKFRKELNQQVQSVLFPHPEAVRRATSGKIRKAVQSLLPKGGYTIVIRQWEAFYQDVFGLYVDFSGIAIPKAPDGFNRLIIVAQGITLNAAINACRDRFPTWTYYDDLDSDVTKNDRTNESGAYALWVRDRVEADEELANKSANDLASENIPCETLLERIIMGLDFFERTKGHLDINNVTLCAGSRDRGGRVPGADWGYGGFCVSRCRSSDRDSRLRGRRVEVSGIPPISGGVSHEV